MWFIFLQIVFFGNTKEVVKMPVYKDKERSTWFYDFTKKVDGVTYRKRKRGFTTKTEALLQEQYAIENLGKENEEKQNITFAALADIFFSYESTKLKNTTTDQNQRMYGCHIKPNFGNKIVSTITPIELAKWKKNFLKQKYSESFANKVISLFKRIVEFGIKKKYILDADLPDELEKVKLNQIVPERKVWTLDQIHQFLDSFLVHEDKKEYDYWLYFYAYSNSGMRPNEFRCLMKKDIQGDYLVVNKSITSKLKGSGDVIQPPKTSTSVRKVLMPHEIIELLNEYTKDDKPEDFIFGKKKVFSETSLIRYLNVHAKVAGLEPIVLYGFRHSHATNLIKAGVPIKIVSQRLGHKNASTTMNVYWHLFTDDEQQVLEVLKRQN